MTDTPFTVLKAHLLVYGCAILRNSLPKSEWSSEILSDESFVHGQVLSILGSSVNTSIDIIESDLELSDSRIQLRLDARGYFISFGGKRWSVSFLDQPNVVTNDRGIANVMRSHFSLHAPRTAFCTPTRQCIYIAAEEPCLFCTFEGGAVKRLTPKQFEQILSLIHDVNPLESVAIGGGTPSLVDGGASYHRSLVDVAKRMGLSCSVEQTPPMDLDDISMLRDGGLDSLIMNLEIWDEQIRKQVCLGKGKIPLEHYKSAYVRAVNEFGRGNVTSVLLLGLEPVDSTLAGIRALVSLGVIPVIIPYRSYDRSILPSVTVDIDTYLWVEREAGSLMRDSGLDPRLQKGCVGCGGCSVENEIAMESRLGGRAP